MALSGTYASALGELRDTVKWIAVSFTGAGAIIFSGLAVTNIANLTERGHWIAPVALATVPLVASAVVIWVALQVMTATPPPTHELFPRYWEELTGEHPALLSPPMSLGQELPTALAVYGSLAKFDDRLVAALKAVRTSETRLDNTSERQADYTTALATVDALQSTVQDTIDCATYVKTRKKYRTAVYQIAAAGAVAVVGLLASGITSGNLVRSQQIQNANRATTAAPAPVSFRVPTNVSVRFGSRIPIIAGGPNRCPLWNGISALAVGGTYLHPLLLFSGYSDADARAHGVAHAPQGCDDPWLWSTKPGQTVLVPG
jgi:hypothetical protein